jgi:hypothetical protein
VSGGHTGVRLPSLALDGERLPSLSLTSAIAEPDVGLQPKPTFNAANLHGRRWAKRNELRQTPDPREKYLGVSTANEKARRDGGPDHWRTAS